MKNNFFCKSQFANIYESTSHLSKISSQILYGEKFKILIKNKNWIKIKTTFDNYIGYIKKIKYVSKYNPTHKIYTLKTKVFKKPSNQKKFQTNYFLPFASKIIINNDNKKFVEYEKNKWIKKQDIKKINHLDNNYLKILKLFLNTKYVWVGKTYKGIDCSAILQLFFYYNEKFYPRDTKEQIKYSKKKSGKKYKKGDIIFWKGHVAICTNSKKLIHAYGPEKKVLIMPINSTIKRIEKTANLKIIKKSTIKN